MVEVTPFLLVIYTLNQWVLNPRPYPPAYNGRRKCHWNQSSLAQTLEIHKVVGIKASKRGTDLSICHNIEPYN